MSSVQEKDVLSSAVASSYVHGDTYALFSTMLPRKDKVI